MSELELTFHGNQRARDSRNLWPVEDARAFLRGLTVPLERFQDPRTDEMWCALVSLTDAAEFVEHARRLEPVPDPRGHYNTAVHDRYGDGVLPWLADRLDADTGTLRNVPWNVMPLLLCIGTAEAFDLIYCIREIEAPTWDWNTLDKFIAAYVARFPQTAVAGLGKRIVGGDANAAAALKKIAKGRSRLVLTTLGEVVGEVERDRIAKQLKLAAKLEAGEILAVLDQAASIGEMHAWPRFSFEFEDRAEYTGLRIVAVRAKSSDRWGIALERITGCDVHEVDVERYRYGSEVPAGFAIGDSTHAPPAVTFELEDGAESAVGGSVRGSAGAVTVTKELVKALDLKPGKGTEPEGGVGGPVVVLMRAYMATFPGGIWPPVEDAVRALGFVPDEAIVIACTEAFSHVDGAGGDGATKLPSTSKAYKSAAKAIVASDPALFDAGTPNTDWRKHARYKAD